MFILPWALGFIFMFIRPIMSSLIYSFSEVSIGERGLETIFRGVESYRRALVLDAKVLPALVGSLVELLYQVPLIVMFSLFIAVILNQKFRFRLLIRGIFFLPVIIASGVVINILRGDIVSQIFMSGSMSSTMIQATAMREFMLDLGIRDDFVSNIINITNNIFELSWKSGIQILLYLAGLQTIPKQLYEVSKIEGATSWETFWKVTFPIISPITIMIIIYTIIDNFTDYSNEYMIIIIDYAQSLDFSYSAALGWIYFVLIGIILAIVYKIINKHVFYASK